jgi:hypothetical protein
MQAGRISCRPSHGPKEKQLSQEVTYVRTILAR